MARTVSMKHEILLASGVAPGPHTFTTIDRRP